MELCILVFTTTLWLWFRLPHHTHTICTRRYTWRWTRFASRGSRKEAFRIDRNHVPCPRSFMFSMNWIVHLTKGGTSEGKERPLAMPTANLVEHTSYSSLKKNTLVAPFLCLRYSPKLTGANTSELGRSRTWVSQARNRRQRVLLMPRKLPLPHDLLLKVREGLLDLTPWNLVIPRHRPSCAQVVDFLPLCNQFETKSNAMHTQGLRPILPPNVCLKQKLKRATPCTHLIIDSY